MSAVALAQLAIQLLPVVTTGTESFVNWINELRASAQQSGEWTAQEENAYRQALLTAGLSHKAQPDV